MRLNALKNGLYAADVVLPTEDPAAFAQLLADLAEDLQPMGRLQEECVKEIAVCMWRRQRALRVERGMVAKQMIPLDPDHTLPENNWPPLADNPLAAIASPFARKEAMEETTRGIRYLLQQVEAAQLLLSSQREADAEAMGYILETLCILKHTPKNQMAEMLAQEKIRLQRCLEIRESMIRQMQEADLAELSIPRGKRLDAWLRFMARLDRQMEQWWSMLLSLQRIQGNTPTRAHLGGHHAAN